MCCGYFPGSWSNPITRRRFEWYWIRPYSFYLRTIPILITVVLHCLRWLCGHIQQLLHNNLWQSWHRGRRSGWGLTNHSGIFRNAYPFPAIGVLSTRRWLSGPAYSWQAGCSLSGILRHRRDPSGYIHTWCRKGPWGCRGLRFPLYSRRWWERSGRISYSLRLRCPVWLCPFSCTRRNGRYPYRLKPGMFWRSPNTACWFRWPFPGRSGVSGCWCYWGICSSSNTDCLLYCFPPMPDIVRMNWSNRNLNYRRRNLRTSSLLLCRTHYSRSRNYNYYHKNYTYWYIRRLHSS